MAQYDPALKRIVLVFRPHKDNAVPKVPGCGDTVYDFENWCFSYYDNNLTEAVVEPFDVANEKHWGGALANKYIDRNDARKERVIGFQMLEQLPARVRFD